MPELTNPALELYNLCSLLVETGDVNETTDVVIAKNFNVSHWSIELFEIIFIINKNIEKIGEIIIDAKYEHMHELSRSIHLGNLLKLKSCFQKDYIFSSWQSSKAECMSEVNLHNIIHLSDCLKIEDKFVKLSKDQIEFIFNQLDTISRKLEKMVNNKNGFFVDILLEGINKFEFRLDRYHILGINYPLESFSELINNFVSFEKFMNEDFNVDEKSTNELKSVSKLIVKISDTLFKCKNIVENGDWIFDRLVTLYKIIENNDFVKLGQDALKQITHQPGS